MATSIKASNLKTFDSNKLQEGVYMGQREMHIGMHTVIGIAMCPVPYSTEGHSVRDGNSPDDTSPSKVHKSIHDKNVLDVIGKALLNQCGKENVAEFVELKIIGNAKMAVDNMLNSLDYSANGMPDHCGNETTNENQRAHGSYDIIHSVTTSVKIGATGNLSYSKSDNRDLGKPGRKLNDVIVGADIAEAQCCNYILHLINVGNARGETIVVK